MSKSMKALQTSTRRAFALGFALTFLFGGGVVSAQPTPDRFVSFSEFVQAVRSANLSKYGSAPNVRVGSVGAFDEMRRHVMEIYDSVHVTHSYMLDSQYFDWFRSSSSPRLGNSVARVSTRPRRRFRSQLVAIQAVPVR